MKDTDLKLKEIETSHTSWMQEVWELKSLTNQVDIDGVDITLLSDTSQSICLGESTTRGEVWMGRKHMEKKHDMIMNFITKLLLICPFVKSSCSNQFLNLSVYELQE